MTEVLDPTDRWAGTIEAVRSCSDEDLRRIVMAAKPQTLRVCLYQLTHDERIREIKVADNVGQGAPPPAVIAPEDVEWLRERACEVLASYRDGTVDVPVPSRLELQFLLEVYFGVDISAWQMEYWWEEFAAVPHPRWCDWFGKLSSEQAEKFKVVVIGTGMGGLTTAVNLEQAGIPYTVLEKNDGVGGTWHTNHYPGARVDITSRTYSYTWENDWKWKHYFAPQPELKEYFEHIVDKYGIGPNIQLCTEVTEAVWNEPEQQWDLVTRNTQTGEVQQMSAHVIVSAIGIFSKRLVPQFEGMESFQGRIMHTSDWDSSYELEGQRIATIGTGSSGVQIVGPISELAKELYVLQRAGTWIEPTPGYTDPVPDDEQWLIEHLPYYLNWDRLYGVYLLNDNRFISPHDRDIDPDWEDPVTISAFNKGVRDRFIDYVMEKIGDRPDLVEKCIPNYPPLTKRLPKDNGWFDALRKDHVRLIGDQIERFTPQGIRFTTGEEIEVDLIVLATGFDANAFLLPINFVGRNGVTLEERWAPDGARAYLGITIPSFPNLFCLYGPNTNGRASGPCAWGEMQSRYAMEAIKYMIDNDLRSMDVKEETYNAYNRLLDERSKYMPWMDQRQNSYYRNEFGRSATNGPFTNRDYWPWTRRPDPEDYVTDKT